MKMLVANRKMLLSILMMVILIYVSQGVSYARVCQVGDVIAPGESCTYDANGVEVTFSVNQNGDGCRSGGPVFREVFGFRVRIERLDDFCRGDAIERDDTFNSNFSASKNADLSWTVNSVPGTPAVKENEGDQGVSDDPAPPQHPGNRNTDAQQPRSEGGRPTLSVSTQSPLTEATLNGSVVTLTLIGGTYEGWIKSEHANAFKVSGIAGVTLKSTFDSFNPFFDVERISDTEITVELGFEGNIDIDGTLTFTLGADVITNYNGAALTAALPVIANTEWIVASTAMPLTAATLDGSVVTLTLNGGTYERYRTDIENALKVSGMTGVSIGRRSVERISNTQVTVELEYDGNTDRTGTLTFTVESDAIESYKGSALTTQLAVPTQLKQGPKGDVNGDGVVSIQDLILVASSFGETGSHPADANGDQAVDIKDLILVAGVLDEGAAAAPALYLGSLEILTTADVQRWLSQAQQLALTDTTSQRGILFLEQLLASRVPRETVLLANYPNPFNPETWIPYQLAVPTEVILHIYPVNGALVWTLALGHHPAGVYRIRSRAAYWDGRNAFGEPVASGVYFYTLSTESTRDSVTAGDFTATRKLLIRK